MRYSRFKEAFKENGNLLTLAGAAAASFALLNPIPLIAAVVAEAAYLLFVPDSKWYERRLSKRYDEEVRRRRAQLVAQVLPSLRVDMQQRFTRLEGVRSQIETQPVGEEKWFREVLRKLDYLLEKFLMFGSRAEQYRRYLSAVQRELRDTRQRAAPAKDKPQRERQRFEGQNSGAKTRPLEEPAPVKLDSGELTTDPEEVWVERTVQEVGSNLRQQVSDIRRLLAKEEDDNTKAVLEKRSDLLRQREESVAKIGRILINLNHQLRLLEDTFGLINDEIRARSPEQILTDIEDVVGQTDTMTKVLDEFAPYEQAISRVEQMQI